MHSYLPLTLGDIILDNARRFGDVPAYVCEGRQLTHAQLLERARQLVSALYRARVRRQDRVSILAMNTLEYGEVLAAGQLSGAIIATVNFRLAPPEMLWILNDAAPRVLIFEARYLEVIDQLRPQLPSIETYVCIGASADWAIEYEQFLASGDAGELPIQATQEDIACLIYTSGTTGRPKGCMLGQGEMRVLAHILANEMRCGCDDRVLLVMPMFHIGAMAVGLGVQFRGGTVVLHRQFDPPAALNALREQKITILHLAPTLVQMLLEHAEQAQIEMPNVRTLLYSAAPMPVPLLRRAMEAMPQAGFLNLYGQTEVVTSGLPREMHRPEGSEREQRWLLSVGHPFPNTQVRILDDQGRECPVGVAGEIVVRTGATFRGYWNNTAATLETLRDGWCRTGDIGRFDEDGLLYLVDRKKDVIISGGENIYSREVEEALASHSSVAECAVIGLPDPKWGESVCAIVVTKPGASVSEDELIDHVRTQIASYKRPRRIEFTQALPKLPTGKINKVELRKTYASQAPSKQ